MSAELAELVEAARDGDQAAFEELVRRTTAETYTLALRLTANEEDARDVTQEAYLRAYKGLKRFRGEAQFTTWLYRITANCASTHRGRQAKHRHDELTEATPLEDLRREVDPEGRAEDSLDRDRVSAALSELPDTLRRVVVLRDIYDLPHEAIAEELGISEGAAKVRLHRARNKLRERLFPLRTESNDDAEGTANAV
ncbi:MAG: sigma-70 family RNA polymerase sigma factor [Actinobacteria bacterium]|nr:sigma-70 family RNA polymerase sigma factor [Actinomycetota bacterium]